MMVAEQEEENSKSGVGDAPQDRYEREPVRRTPVKIGEGEGLDKGSWSRNEDSEGMDRIQEGSWFFRAS